MKREILNHGNLSLLAFTRASPQEIILSHKEDAFALTYDDEGNVTRRTKISDGSYRENTYDYRNRLTQVQDKNVSNTVLADFDYTYDVFDHLIKRSVDADGPGGGAAVVDRYVYNGDQVAFKFDGSNTLEDRYLSAPMIDQIMADEDSLGAILTPLTDLQGSVTDLVNTSGSSQNHINYSAFGDILAQSGSASFICGFDGMMKNEETATWQGLGNTFTPGTGGWNTPVVALGLNPYSYGNGNPPNRVQPAGMMPQPVNPPAGPMASPADYAAQYQQWMTANSPPPAPNPGSGEGPTMSMGTNTLRASSWRNGSDLWPESQREIVKAEVAEGQKAAVNVVEGLTGFVPGAGFALDYFHLTVGEDIGGHKLSVTERAVAGASVALSIAGFLLGPLLSNLDDIAPAALRVGDSGQFSALDARAVVGDGLTPHHMPQAALAFTPYEKGGALVLPHALHVLTRTWGPRGAINAGLDAGRSFRAVLAMDIRDIRKIAGSHFNPGMLDLIQYYRTVYPQLMVK